MASQAIIDALTKQILAQGTQGWTGEGFGSAEANARDMARILAEAGITDIKQFGVKTVKVPASEQVVLDEGGQVSSIIPIPETTKQIYVNKATGQEIMPEYARAGGNIWSGTYSGQGSTGYGVRFDAQGNPQFYTEYGGTTSDWVPFREGFLKPAALMAGLAYGANALGLTGSGAGAGAAGAAGAAGGLGPLELAIAAGEGILPVSAAQTATTGLTAAQLASLGSGIGLGSTGLLSGITGALSNLTPTQISNLAQAGLGLVGAGAAGAAVGGAGGGGGAGGVGALPTQAPPGYDQNYFDALNAYYGAYLPGQQADTSMLSSWYNRQPYQVSQFNLPTAAGGAPIAPTQAGGNASLFNNVFGSLFGDYLNPNRVIPGTPTVPSRPAAPITGGPGATPPNVVSGPGDIQIPTMTRQTTTMAPISEEKVKNIQNWWKTNEGKASPEELQNFLATSGYSAAEINKALPQFSVNDLNNAMRIAVNEANKRVYAGQLPPASQNMPEYTANVSAIPQAEIEAARKKMYERDPEVAAFLDWRRGQYGLLGTPAELMPEDPNFNPFELSDQKFQEYKALQENAKSRGVAEWLNPNWQALQAQKRAETEAFWRQRGEADIRSGLVTGPVSTPAVASPVVPVAPPPPPTQPMASAPTQQIQSWYAQNQGGSQENLDKFLATSGYSPEMINQALPQFGVTDLQAAMANARQRLGL